MLGGVAAAQLAAWEKLAQTWPLSRDGRVWRCADCQKGVLLAADRGGREYRYLPDEFRAHVVLHLRNHHANLDPDRG